MECLALLDDLPRVRPPPIPSIYGLHGQPPIPVPSAASVVSRHPTGRCIAARRAVRRPRRSAFLLPTRMARTVHIAESARSVTGVFARAARVPLDLSPGADDPTQS